MLNLNMMHRCWEPNGVVSLVWAQKQDSHVASLRFACPSLLVHIVWGVFPEIEMCRGFQARSSDCAVMIVGRDEEHIHTGDDRTEWRRAGLNPYAGSKEW